MIVADYIARYLAARGVSHVFELSGGMITPLLDAMSGKITLVSCHHEQAAGFAAEGSARVSEIPGVAMATSGPGATNLLTPIASCYFDSTPALFLTGQVNRIEMRRGQRQRGFQETDVVAMAAPVTKAAWQVFDPASVAGSIDAAWNLTTEGRPGPVLLDIPFDVLRSEIHGDLFMTGPDPRPGPLLDDVEAAIAMLQVAERPLILLGGGCVRHADAVRRAVNHLWVPVVHSLMAKGIVAQDHPMRIGFIGSYGNRWANWALSKCDALLVLGSRLDVRQTGSDTAEFARGRRIMQVDVDHREFFSRVEVERPIVSDVGLFCEAMIDPDGSPVNGRGIDVSAWHAEIAAKWRAWPDAIENKIPAEAINPNLFLRFLGDRSWERDVSNIVVDVGQHQMWAAQSFPVHRGQRWLTSGGHGAMGFALPAAIGAALATGQPTLAIVGDGGFQINVGALHTIARLKLPIKIVVMNNDGHGMVRQFQEEVFGGRVVSTSMTSPVSMQIANAYGLRAGLVLGADGVDRWIEWLLKDRAPALLEAWIHPSVKALPKLAFGRRLDDMEPIKTVQRSPPDPVSTPQTLGSEGETRVPADVPGEPQP